jgi:hypothetical protein
MVVLCSTSSLASHFDNYSKDVKIQDSLEVLKNANAIEVFDSLSQNGFKIVFYDLTQISYDYVNHFAINTIDSFGNRYILINSKYRNASPEEIACIIAHESCHVGAIATLDEETYATETEAHYWQILKNHNKTYNKSALLERLDNLVALKMASTRKNNLIENKIATSSFYMNQLAIK